MLKCVASESRLNHVELTPGFSVRLHQCERRLCEAPCCRPSWGGRAPTRPRCHTAPHQPEHTHSRLCSRGRWESTHQVRANSLAFQSGRTQCVTSSGPGQQKKSGSLKPRWYLQHHLTPGAQALGVPERQRWWHLVWHFWQVSSSPAGGRREADAWD